MGDPTKPDPDEALSAFDREPESAQRDLIDELVDTGKIHPEAAQALRDAGQGSLEEAKEADVSILGGQFTETKFDLDDTPLGTPVSITIKGYVRRIGPKLVAGKGTRLDVQIQRTSVTTKVG